MLHTELLGRTQFKPQGIKKNSVPYVFRLYLPMFWFNVGLFTFMKMDSLMVLACPWSSLPMMLKAGVCNAVSCLLYVHMDGRGLLEVFLASFSKGPCCSPFVLLNTVYVVVLEAVDNPPLISLGSWSFGFFSTCLIVVLPLKCTCISYLPQMYLKLSTSPFVYGITTCPTVELGLAVVGVVLAP